MQPFSCFIVAVTVKPDVIYVKKKKLYNTSCEERSVPVYAVTINRGQRLSPTARFWLEINLPCSLRQPWSRVHHGRTIAVHIISHSVVSRLGAVFFMRVRSDTETAF